MSNQRDQNEFTRYYAQPGTTFLSADSNTPVTPGASAPITFIVSSSEATHVSVAGSTITFLHDGIYAINTYTRVQPFSIQTLGVGYELTLVATSTVDSNYNTTIAWVSNIPANISATTPPSITYHTIPISVCMYFHATDTITLNLKNDSATQIATVLSTGTQISICKIV